MVGTHHPRRLTVELQRINDYVWEIPRQGGMRVPGRIYASEKLMAELRDDPALAQLANVAHLPGIVGCALAMPDMHWGYGFPIGGVAAVDAEEGAISPGGIGFDINCGVRLLRTALAADDVTPHLGRIADALDRTIPAGGGTEGAIPKLTRAEEKQMLARGAAWAVARELGRPSDLEATEEGGCLRDADPDAVSETALERGRSQVGTLGSGNHFLEVQRVDEVYDARAAAALGLVAGQVRVMIHSGSRGLGYQVCDDALRTMGRAMAHYGIGMPDRQLACVPLGSPEGQQYFAAMAAAANFAWTNRQVMSGLAERAFTAALGLGPAALRFGLVYDVCHNIAKVEEHPVDGRPRLVCVHRKGATRAFGPGHPALAAHLRPLGQPVIIPGDMGRYSFLLLGTAGAMAETFGTTCHGAGRVMSRAQAKNAALGLRDRRLADAIARAAAEVAEGKLDGEFVVGVCQTGSGTSTNMNANEVIANRALELLGARRGDKSVVHPNDHVNMGQSTNDVFPTAIHVAAYGEITRALLPALDELGAAFEERARAFADVVKAGRTHLQDAVPMTLGQEFGGYASVIRHGIARVKTTLPHLAELPIGGTALGTGLNAPPGFGEKVAAELASATGLPFVTAPDRFEAMQNRDAAVETSGALRTLAVGLMKIANDLRLLTSGGRTGLNEIELPATQPGSSIMPGKVNPVIPEAVNQVAALVIGHDATIAIAGLNGNLDLNVMKPVIAHALLEQVAVTAAAARVFARKCVVGIRANVERCRQYAELTGQLVTAIAPVVGYDRAAELFKKAMARDVPIRQVLEDEKVLPKEETARLLDLHQLARGGRAGGSR